jgi:geranylgeranyl pyrophosphate synthase
VELSKIYAPVNEDLIQVEKAIRAVAQVDFKWLAQLLEHSLSAGGKRIRPALTLMSGRYHKYQLDVLIHMAIAIELLHTATLVHDDAIDESDMRRGRTTVYKLWGVDAAVLLGDYLFAKAGVSAADTQNLRAIRLFSSTLMTISKGELNQGINSFNIKQTREDYNQRIFGKTASLFCLSTESGAILSNAPESGIQILKNYGYNLGMAFQIVDDILDFIGTEAELGKPAGSDLLQGTLTLPAMMLNERYPNDNPVKKLFETRDKSCVKLAIEQIRNSPIVEDSYKVAREYCQAAINEIKKLPDNEVRRAMIDLSDFVVLRKT